MMRSEVEEYFFKDIANHKMTVLLDNGIYRHLRFAKPNERSYWFEIITYPGELILTGDMGTYVFRRLEDMFTFFRSENKNATNLEINPSYWGEKLVATGNNSLWSSHLEFSGETFRKRVEENLKDWLADETVSEEEGKQVTEEVAGMLDAINNSEDERESIGAARDFSFKVNDHRFEFYDPWEWNCKEFRYHYLWCCYAIVWGIAQYDKQPYVV